MLKGLANEVMKQQQVLQHVLGRSRPKKNGVASSASQIRDVLELGRQLVPSSRSIHTKRISSNCILLFPLSKHHQRGCSEQDGWSLKLEVERYALCSNSKSFKTYPTEFISGTRDGVVLVPTTVVPAESSPESSCLHYIWAARVPIHIQTST